MMRALRIVKPVSERNESSGAVQPQPVPHPDIPANITHYIVSVARRYQNQGLNLAQLIAAGEEGWQRAQRHYGPAADQLERWGSWWVRESILRALNAPLSDGPSKE